jgi:hypothetical protein
MAGFVTDVATDFFKSAMRNCAHAIDAKFGFAASFYKRDISRAWYVAQACEYGVYVSIPAVTSYGLPEESVERRMVRIKSPFIPMS